MNKGQTNPEDGTFRTDVILARPVENRQVVFLLNGEE
jgi:hypothetical protein